MPKAMPEIDYALCKLCGDCVIACPCGALSIVDEALRLDQALCSYCGDCEDVCPEGAIALPYEIRLADSDAPDPRS